MRHKKKGNHLGRTSSHKKALMRNLAAQLIEHKEIKTTEAKAKELRGYVERLITYGKKGAVHHRRLAFKFLQNKDVVTELFDSIAQSYEDRNGGYTRIIKLGRRKGDGASVTVMQLVGYEPGSEASKTEKKAKKETKKATPKEEKPTEKTEKITKDQVAEKTETEEKTESAKSTPAETAEEDNNKE